MSMQIAAKPRMSEYFFVIQQGRLIRSCGEPLSTTLNKVKKLFKKTLCLSYK